MGLVPDEDEDRPRWALRRGTGEREAFVELGKERRSKREKRRRWVESVGRWDEMGIVRGGMMSFLVLVLLLVVRFCFANPYFVLRASASQCLKTIYF